MDIYGTLEKCGIALDQKGVGVTERDGLYLVSRLMENMHRLHICTELGTLPDIPGRELAELLLTASLPSPAAGPGTVAYLKDSGSVVYRMAVGTDDLDPEVLEQTYGLFRKKALEIRLKMEELAGRGTAAEGNEGFNAFNAISGDVLVYA